MALKFNIKDFFSPLNLIKKSLELHKTQWMTREQLEDVQLNKLNSILQNTKKYIPYYKEILETYDFDLNPLKDMKQLSTFPILKRESIRNNLENLISNNVNINKLSKVTTSGSAGTPLTLYMDKKANSLEFTFYLRFWGWHGYKLRDKFAELSTYSFRNLHDQEYIFSLISNRLILNSIKLSNDNVRKYHSLLKEFKPKFFKASPSSLINFVFISQRLNLSGYKFHAIFTSGEVLTNKDRKIIEDYFECKVFDTYGHMERTFAACECEYQNLHINSDYGIVELEKIESQKNQYKIYTTGLHNYAMPLIRYDVGDIIEYDPEKQECACGRKFPIIKRVLGRENDIIKLKNGKIITAMYLVFDDLKEILSGQIIQTQLDEFKIRIIPSSLWNEASEKTVIHAIKSFVNEDIKVYLEILSSQESLTIPGEKFKSIISKI